MKKDINIEAKVNELLTESIDNIFIELQTKLKIDNGDCPPDLAIMIDNARETLASVIAETIELQWAADRERFLGELCKTLERATAKSESDDTLRQNELPDKLHTAYMAARETLIDSFPETETYAKYTL